MQLTALLKKAFLYLNQMRSIMLTYVFRGNWKEASQLTKAEILCGQLHEARIIHNEKRKININMLINNIIIKVLTIFIFIGFWLDNKMIIDFYNED